MNYVKSATEIEAISKIFMKSLRTYQKSKHIFLLVTKYHRNIAPNKEFNTKHEMIKNPSAFET